jgi:FAD:protein FMN transferase
VFGDHATVQRQQKTLDPAPRERLEHSSNFAFSEPSYTFYVNDQAGHAAGYAVIIDEIGKSEPITFMVGMTPEGKVSDVAVMVFRENRGWEVKEKRFLRQFHGKTLRNSIRVDEDIINYTGATLSSKAVARGVKRALLLLSTFYPRETRGQLQPAKPNGVRPAVFPLATMIDAHGPVALYRQRRIRMGTVCEIRVWTRSTTEAQRAFTAGFAEIERIEQMFSSYRPESELSFVNREAGRGPVEVTEEFFDLTRYAVHSAERSGGAFDITVGPLVSAWGFRDGNPRVPSRTELHEALMRVGSSHLVVSRKGRTIQFQRQGMALDFGGLAKGHAAKCAAQIARRHGAMSALVNLGGSSLAASETPTGGAGMNIDSEWNVPWGDWIVGVTDPGNTAQCALFLILRRGWSLSTSGTYEQQVQIEGTQVSHLLDPRSGEPIQGSRSLTAIARSGRRSEVMSKYLLALCSAERSSIFQRPKSVDWVYLENSAEGSSPGEINFYHTVRLSRLL